jgi:phosphoglucosamine mutase
MPKKLFGTDGVRGVANAEPMTAETALRLGRAIAYLSRNPLARRHRILVGKDTRISSDMLEMGLAAGICSTGADALLVGHMPTPGIAFLTVNMRCNAGAVISASHNPFEHNGIKFFGGDGYKLSDELEERIEGLIDSQEMDCVRPTGERVGRTVRIDDALGRYIVFLKTEFPRQTSLDGMKMVLDCANGAAYKAAPLVFDELGVNVTAVNVDPDGKNINMGCGSLHTEVVRDLVSTTCADLGVALDGDADRVLFSDEKGQAVDGDQIMGILAWDMMQKGCLQKNTVVATVMSNLGLALAMKEMGGTLVRTQVGDRYVVEHMRKEGFNFGGEQSGHIIFLDRNTSGDGILTGLQVMKVMKETGKPLSELAERVKRYPQVLKNVELTKKKNFNEIPEVKRAISDCEEKLKDRGRVLVRCSGTENLCRVMVEGENVDLVNRLADAVVDAIARNA